uniref:UspA domain-containing protein n=1 Tax=Arion vulgaris TaxID=1028688 RepID=A0A0B7BR48_9EUPU
MADQRNCVVAVDGSEHSDYAFDWYYKQVHREGDHVVLVYIPELNDMLHSSRWSNSVYVFDRDVMEAMLREEQERIKADLEVFAQKLKDHGLGGKVKSVMASKPGEGIIKAAEEEHADLIVVGSRGKGTLRRTFVGSVSDYIVHHSHVPVFVCKHPHKHVHPEETH